jgi:two-component system, chemotaxis family, chemotaxis protein CheY
MASAKIRVLVIDDASLVRAYYRQALERAGGYEIDEALNGLEGLEKLLMHPFDVVIVDINMPQMDGVTFLRTLRSKDLPTSGIPALVTSTEAGPQDRSAARAAGANYYLVKPVSQTMLAEYAGMLAGAVR